MLVTIAIQKSSGTVISQKTKTELDIKHVLFMLEEYVRTAQQAQSIIEKGDIREFNYPPKFESCPWDERSPRVHKSIQDWIRNREADGCEFAFIFMDYGWAFTECNLNKQRTTSHD